jgi:hypothetical protein
LEAAKNKVTSSSAFSNDNDKTKLQLLSKRATEGVEELLDDVIASLPQQ